MAASDERIARSRGRNCEFLASRREAENRPLCEGCESKVGVVGNHKIRASSRPWAGGHDLMPKPRWCGGFPPVHPPEKTAVYRGVSQRGYGGSLGR